MKKTTLFLLIMVTTLFAQDEFKLLTTVHGEKEGDEYSKIASLGDINGDGFDDFIVGSQKKNYLKLYFGGNPFDTLNCLRFQIRESFTAYNASFAGNGDLNGDGYKDFVLGAHYDMFNFGKVFIHFGGSTIDTVADLTISGQGYYYFFGAHIAINGDLNGDGYDDLVVSAPNDDYDARGRVYIYFGGKEMDTECDVFLEGKEPFDVFGGSLSIIGDINGDGYDDLLIGAPQIHEKNKPGKAYLFFGGENIGFGNCVEFVGSDSVKGNYGMFVSGLGDINGDGFKDFGIASGDYVNIILGGEKIGSNNIFNVYTNNEISFIGGLYDFNKNGYSDYVIVRKNIDIYGGASILDTVPDISFDFWANPIRNIGDINGDNKEEIAFGIGGGWDTRGRVEIYSYGKINGIEESFNSILTDYIVSQNYPNPFNPHTNLKYKLNKELSITIDVFNIHGEKVKEIFTGIQHPGEYTTTWDSTNELNSKVASGVYFFRFITKNVTGDFTEYQKIIKMVLLK